VQSSGDPNAFFRSEPCAIGLPACRPAPLSAGTESVSEPDAPLTCAQRSAC
jgi:hypothetical protein